MIKSERATRPALTTATALAMLVCLTGAASAQTADPGASDAMRPATRHVARPHYARPGGHYRALTVRRRQPVEPDVAVLPPPSAGPGVIVTGPVRAASEVVDLPFRILDGIFPSEGSVAANPLVLVGAPIQAAGRIVQVPFRIVEAPFVPAAYSEPSLF